jgi:hypothetical protein
VTGKEPPTDPATGVRLHPDGTLPGTPKGIRVFPIDGEYVVANRGGWVDGAYPTADAAIAAATPKPRTSPDVAAPENEGPTP